MGNLMKCPFCGGEARIDINVALGGYRVACKSKLKCGAMFEWYDTEKEAVEAWNTRKPMEAVVAELEKEKAIHTEHFRISLYKDYPEIKQMYEKVCLVIDKAIEIVRGKE